MDSRLRPQPEVLETTRPIQTEASRVVEEILEEQERQAAQLKQADESHVLNEILNEQERQAVRIDELLQQLRSEGQLNCLDEEEIGRSIIHAKNVELCCNPCIKLGLNQKYISYIQ